MAHTRKKISTLEFEISITERSIKFETEYMASRGDEPEARVQAETSKVLIEEQSAELADLKAALVIVKERRAKKLAKEAAAVWADHHARKAAQSA